MLIIIFLGYHAFTQQGALLISSFVISIIGFCILAGYSFATSKCPSCVRHMNLAGPSGHCPHCGVFIPYKAGETEGANSKQPKNELSEQGSESDS